MNELPLQALIELVHYSFLLDVGDRARHTLQLRHAAALVLFARGRCPQSHGVADGRHLSSEG